MEELKKMREKEAELEAKNASMRQSQMFAAAAKKAEEEKRGLEEAKRIENEKRRRLHAAGDSVNDAILKGNLAMAKQVRVDFISSQSQDELYTGNLSMPPLTDGVDGGEAAPALNVEAIYEDPLGAGHMTTTLGLQPVHLAAYTGSIEVMEWLLELAIEKETLKHNAAVASLGTEVSSDQTVSATDDVDSDPKDANPKGKKKKGKKAKKALTPQEQATKDFVTSQDRTMIQVHVCRTPACVKMWLHTYS